MAARPRELGTPVQKKTCMTEIYIHLISALFFTDCFICVRTGRYDEALLKVLEELKKSEVPKTKALYAPHRATKTTVLISARMHGYQ